MDLSLDIAGDRWTAAAEDAAASCVETHKFALTGYSYLPFNWIGWWRWNKELKRLEKHDAELIARRDQLRDEFYKVKNAKNL